MTVFFIGAGKVGLGKDFLRLRRIAEEGVALEKLLNNVRRG